MTPEHYNDLIERMGWASGGKAARALHVDPRTERRWVSGEMPRRPERPNPRVIPGGFFVFRAWVAGRRPLGAGLIRKASRRRDRRLDEVRRRCRG